MQQCTYMQYEREEDHTGANWSKTDAEKTTSMARCGPVGCSHLGEKKQIEITRGSASCDATGTLRPRPTSRMNVAGAVNGRDLQRVLWSRFQGLSPKFNLMAAALPITHNK
eukprot:s176_g36.t1